MTLTWFNMTADVIYILEGPFKLTERMWIYLKKENI